MLTRDILKGLLISVGCAVVCACTPIQRGFMDGTFISTSLPPVTMVTNLPTIVSGRGSCFIYSTEAAFVTPDFWMSVSGTTADAPMAIVTYAVAPLGYEWSGNAASYVDNEEIGKMDLDGNRFNIVLRSVSFKNDPFSPLFLNSNELKSTDRYWIAARYVDPAANNWTTKIIMEYREPMPNSVIKDVRVDKQLHNQDIQEFLKRASHAFSFAKSAPKDVNVSPCPFLPAILQSKKIGNFIGALERKSLPLMADPL